MDARKESMQSKTFKPEHEYGNQYKNMRVDAEYLSVKYVSNFKDDPTLRMRDYSSRECIYILYTFSRYIFV
jgi:hypothetical protein